MGWRDLLGCSKNENIGTKAAISAKASREMPFADIADIADKTSNSNFRAPYLSYFQRPHIGTEN